MLIDVARHATKIGAQIAGSIRVEASGFEMGLVHSAKASDLDADIVVTKVSTNRMAARSIRLPRLAPSPVL